MSVHEVVAGYLVLAVAAGILVAVWARAWRRNPIAWGVVAFLVSPFGFWAVVLALVIRGRRQG